MNKPSPEQIRVWGEKISESDRKAFDSLFYALYARLVRFSYRYVGSKAVASDVVQDAFVILWEKRRELDPQRSIKAYLYRIVRNRSLNYLRDHAEETIGLEVLTNDKQPVSDSGSHPSGYDELFDLLQVWIKELPDRQREAFELSRFEGLDHDEIAKVMEISSNTVNNHIVAALQYLRERHDAYYEEVNEE